jgi:hypothetical protein
MSQFGGSKCDICGKEDRSEVQNTQSTPQQMAYGKGDTEASSPDTEASSPREKPWMRMWWMNDQDFCPSCSAVVSSAVVFARNILRNRM